MVLDVAGRSKTDVTEPHKYGVDWLDTEITADTVSDTEYFII